MTSTSLPDSPAVHPWQRENVPDVDAYRAGQPVFAWSCNHAVWLAAQVLVVGDYGLQLHVEMPGGRTAVDTLRPEYVMPRDTGGKP